MISKAIRISTIVLFSGLIGLFVAYKADRFDRSDKKHQPTADSRIVPTFNFQLPLDQGLQMDCWRTTSITGSNSNSLQPGLDSSDNSVNDKPFSVPSLDLSELWQDSVFMMMASSKSGVAIDKKTSLILLESALTPDKKETISAGSGNKENLPLPSKDVLFPSSKIIISTDQTFLASGFKTAFYRNWRFIFDAILLSNDSLKLQKDERFHETQFKPFKNSIDAREWILQKPLNTEPDYLILDNLASTSKSIVLVDRKPLADSLKRLILLKNFEKKFDSLKKKDHQ